MELGFNLRNFVNKQSVVQPPVEFSKNSALKQNIKAPGELVCQNASLNLHDPR